MQALSAYIAGALRRPLPPAVQEKTKHHLLDTFAAMLSGSRLPPGKKAIAFAKTLGGAKEASVAGSRIATGAAHAALANGMLGHADETDDSHAPPPTRPGCAVLAAARARAGRVREGRRDAPASRVRLRRRMRIVGLVGVAEHAVGERGMGRARRDAAAGDRSLFCAA